jgi:hypothetical protein
MWANANSGSPMQLSMKCAFFAIAGLLSFNTMVVPPLAFGEDKQPAKVLTHPALRTALPVSQRPLAAGKHYLVNPIQGDDSAAGSEDSPWKTIGHSVKLLQPGDTLCLREGVYYENVYIALQGTAEQPITIRAYPGERAVIDGSWREFRESPEKAWEAVPNGAPGEFISTKPYPNARDVVGAFGDSNVGLQTYYHAQDLQSENEFVAWIDPDQKDKTDIKPLYCGPGLWHNPVTGRIHCRLAHTHLPAPVSNYAGETDPRKVPLIISSFRSVPLHLDGAKQVRIEGITLRGAGYTATIVDHGQDIVFDRVTIWCGTYGLQIWRTTDLKFLNSALYGSVAPWTFRSDGSKRDYPGRPHRNISRLNTHSLIEIDSGGESSVFATPQNDRWEFAHSLFTDAHDGLYFGGVNVKFHHNLIENLQDDGIYLSPMYMRHRLDKNDPEIHVYENVFRGMLTALAFGGTETDTRDTAFVYRNLFDLTLPVQTGRPAEAGEQPGISYGKLIGDHGSPPWCAMNLYQNTIVAREANRDGAMGALNAGHATRIRRVFNNIFFHETQLSGFPGIAATTGTVSDGNLYWSPASTVQTTEAFFRKFRTSPAYEESKANYAAGSTTNSIVADPVFEKFQLEGKELNDYRLLKNSPALEAGVVVPEAWPDPSRKADAGKPDIGAYPLGSKQPEVGPQPE